MKAKFKKGTKIENPITFLKKKDGTYSIRLASIQAVINENGLEITHFSCIKNINIPCDHGVCPDGLKPESIDACSESCEYRYEEEDVDSVITISRMNKKEKVDYIELKQNLNNFLKLDFKDNFGNQHKPNGMTLLLNSRDWILGDKLVTLKK